MYTDDSFLGIKIRDEQGDLPRGAKSTRASTFTYSAMTFETRFFQRVAALLAHGDRRKFLALVGAEKIVSFRRNWRESPGQAALSRQTIARYFLPAGAPASECWGSSMRAMIERNMRASSLAYGRAAIAASARGATWPRRRTSSRE